MSDFIINSSQIAANFNKIKVHVSQSALASSHQSETVRLIAVSKNFTVEHIITAIEAGCIEFGENRVQEAESKWLHLKALYPHIKLHLIGHLQTNKVKRAVSLFDVIHSLDNENLAKELSKQMLKQKKDITILVQVNLGNESQKRGISSADLPEFMHTITHQYKIAVSGLMCIPPVHTNASYYFNQLRSLAKQLIKEQISTNLKLSMGMSGDYQAAILAGADYVRIGRAIFGSRDNKLL
jgi:pyridoxal phosphate enzyme (YggS family)